MYRSRYPCTDIDIDIDIAISLCLRPNRRMWGRLAAAGTAARPAAFASSGADTRAREAERDVSERLQSGRALFGELRVWHSLRVPARDLRGRVEIDVVAVNSGGVHVIEVKHWTGLVTLSQTTGGWRQQRRDGSVVDHPNVLAELSTKADSLLAMLHARGCALPPGALSSWVVMTNPRCTLPPELSGRADVVACDGLAAFLRGFEQSVASNLASRVLPAMLTGVRLAGPELRLVCERLDDLGTWDTLHLNGGRVLVGDARGLLGADAPPALALAALRPHVAELAFEHRRSLVVGGTLALLGREPATTLRPLPRPGADRRKLPPTTHVPITTELTFQTAGSAAPARFRVNDIERLIISVEPRRAPPAPRH